ncbi:tetratricopeptide repeat protein [Halomicrobium sp. IBSBa]|uniref:tetratricopeptide repeat protein n=1 Tax=Halomicrobium sp. IBSBa TaxID=2778916 RepID=UPI001ABFD01D|nr:tetratricopeptide repeat protein [Halomicrobium sp. IBSBa]MBO4248402.1 tetratricopeptide repeat protein [Halomicrobium sp. IBSBa]
MTDDDADEGELVHASVEELADAVMQCAGHYSFLIGAGTSVHDVPTAGMLIEQWREEKYEIVDPDEGREEWVEQKEAEEMSDDEGEYGFWFEQRHKTVGERRHFIEDLVEDADPNFGHIVLASMMTGLNGEDDDEDGSGYVPVTLTPNFDDLLYDAFYLFLEDKPLVVDHNVIASQFQLTRDRPAIIKLHGDYLYNNIQNTSDETADLEENIERAMSLVLQEYGMIVLGYSGEDDSIMQVFEDEEFEIPDYGLFWCTLDIDDISERVKKILKKSNAFVVEINGSEETFNKIYSYLNNNDGFRVPNPDRIEERAKERSDQLREVVEEGGPESLDLVMQGRKERAQGNHHSALELFSQAVEENPENARCYHHRGNTYREIGKYDNAISDFTQAIRLEPNVGEFYHSRGLAHENNGNYKQAVEDYSEAIKIDGDRSHFYQNRGVSFVRLSEYELAKSDYKKSIKIDNKSSYARVNLSELHLILQEYESALKESKNAIQVTQEDNLVSISLVMSIMSKIMLDMDYSTEESRLETVHDESDSISWNFSEIEGWIGEQEFNQNQEREIKRILNMVQ